MNKRIDDEKRLDFGKRLKEIRREYNITQEQLAEKLEISQKHYSEVERGIAGLSVKNMVLISNMFDVSLDYLIKGDNTNHDLSSLEEMYLSMSPYARGQLLSIAQSILDIEKHAGRLNDK